MDNTEEILSQFDNHFCIDWIVKFAKQFGKTYRIGHHTLEETFVAISRFHWDSSEWKLYYSQRDNSDRLLFIGMSAHVVLLYV